MIEIGSSGGWLARIHDKINSNLLSVQTGNKRISKLIDVEAKSRGFLNTIKNNSGKTIGLLESIKQNTKDTVKALKGMPKGQEGYVSTKTQLVELHGTPENPEYVLRSQDLSRMLSLAGDTKSQPQQIKIEMNNTVNLQGTIISDRDYARNRLIPEIENALRANFKKSQFKEILGLT